MDWDQAKDHIKGLWATIRGVKRVPGYISIPEVLYILRGDMHLSLRLLDSDQGPMWPLIFDREQKIVGIVSLPSVFVSLLEESWIQADEAGNYRPTETGLARLAECERHHLELGDCLECGGPVHFLKELPFVEKSPDGKCRQLHWACYLNRESKRKPAGIDKS